MASLKRLSQEYLKDLEKNRRSPETVRNYSLYLKRFLDWSKVDDPKKITDKLILRFEKYLQDLQGRKTGLTKATRNAHLVALRNFNRFLNVRGKKTKVKDKIKLKKLAKKKYPQLTKIQIQNLLEAPKFSKDPMIIKLRDTAILNLIVSTGMKVSEISESLKSDVKVSKNEIAIESFSSRILPISRRTSKAIAEYLKKRTDNNDHLFISHDRGARLRGQTNQPMSTRSIQRLIDKYSKIAGLPIKLTATTLRYYFATSLLKKGVDDEDLSIALGFTTEGTARRYS